jgi:adenylosuccinate lyase
MPRVVQAGVPLLEATQWALQQENADDVWRKIPAETIKLLGKPESYTGAAAAKAREIAASAAAYLKG